MASDFFKNKRLAEYLVVFLGVYVVYGAYLTFMQERIAYQPTSQDFFVCGGLAQAEKITYQGTRMYFKDNGPRIVVLYHGNFGSACDRAFYAGLFEEEGYSYLLPEYAGYSNDSLKPSHELLKKDVENTISFLKERNFSEVAVIGESVGNSFAAYHVSLMAPQRILLISPFIDFLSIAEAHYGYYPVSLLVKNPFDNIRLIGDFSEKVTLMHGEKDDIIPLSLGKKLFESLVVPHKELIVIPGVGHNDLFAAEESWQVIRDFLR
jgi:hypothetical protein